MGKIGIAGPYLLKAQFVSPLFDVLGELVKVVGISHEEPFGRDKGSHFITSSDGRLCAEGTVAMRHLPYRFLAVVFRPC